MLPLPKSFKGQTLQQIANRLLKDGYRALLTNDAETLLRHPRRDHLIRLSSTPDLTAAFCEACDKNAGNPFLPKIFAHAVIGPDLHFSVTENLLRGEELPEPEAVTLSGHARAVSSLFEGDEMHEDVHPYMVKDANLLAAVQAIIECGLNAEQSVTIDSRGDSIYFRGDSQGSCHTVYANPLVPASGVTPAEAREKLQWVEKRFSAQERNAASSPYWRPTARPL